MRIFCCIGGVRVLGHLLSSIENRLGTAMKAYSNLEAFYSSLVKGENGTSGS